MAHPLDRDGRMRFIVTGIRQSTEEHDHREFDDFREGLVSDLLSDEFSGFWGHLLTELGEPPPKRPTPQWLELLALVHVT